MIALYLPVVLAVSLWSPLGERCATIAPEQVAMHCTSGTVLGGEQVGPGYLSAEVWLDPTNGYGWASLALNADVPADNRYASAALVQRIAPFEDVAEPMGVLLAQMPSHANAYTLVEAPPGWHRLTVAYDGAGSATACVDDICERVAVELPRWRYQLICAGVSPGTPGQNAATCLFRHIEAHPWLLN